MARRLRGVCPSGKEFNALVNHPKIGRIEAYRDWMENNGVVRSVDEVLEKLDKRYSTSTVREGVSELFESNPELAKIGTPEQYSQYLDTIFPESKVKDIVYHGTEGKFDKFDIKFFGKNDYGDLGKGFYFAFNKADIFNEPIVISAIVNDVEAKTSPGYEIMIPKSEQIHILGTKEDIEGFQNFVSASAEERVAFYSDKYNATVDGVNNENIVANGSPITFSKESNANTKAVRQITTLLNTLANKLGVRYEIVTEEKAKEVTRLADNPWTSQPAFYYNDTVYFIENRLNPNIVVHEFAHPLVRGIARSNPKLFNKLYTELKGTSEGRSVIAEVAEVYTDLDEQDDMFKEEAITRSLELKAVNEKLDIGMTKGFLDYVKSLVNGIRNWFKSFVKKVDPQGKINVSKLDENTTLDELAGMLMGTKAFSFDEVEKETKETDLTKQVAYFAYLRDQMNEIAGMNQVAPQDLMTIATQGVKAAGRNLRRIKASRNKEEMFEVLKDEFGKSNLEEIRSNLQPYTEYMEKRLSEIIDEVEYNKNHVEALVNTYFRLSKTLQKVTAHLKEIVKDVDNPENLARAHSYRSFLNTWEDFINHTITVFDENNLSSDNAISKLVTSIKEEIDRANHHISRIKAEGVRETLFDVLVPINESGQMRFDEMLATYRKYNYKQYMIDRLYVEWYGMTENEWKEFQRIEGTGAVQSPRYQELKEKSFKGAQITKEKIEAALKGEMNDVHWMNSYFESYLYNDDPIVGGLALFVKKALDRTMLKSQANYNDFTSEIQPLLDAAGIGPNGISDLGKRIGFIDSYGRKIDGEFKEYKVWTFLNKWKGDRFATDQMNNDINQARDEFNRTNSETDRQKLIELINKKQEHDIMFMHQEYVPEYYRVRSNFTQNGTNKLAVEALAVRDEVLKKIRNLQEQVPADQDMLEIPIQIKQAWDEYRQLHNLYDIDGKLKTGRDLEITKELQRFRQETSKFYEYNVIEGSFENALFKYEQKLINQGYRGEDFKDARSRWIEENTRVSVKPEFWTSRMAIIDRIKEILKSKKVDPKVANEQAQIAETLDKAYKKLFDATSGFKDDDGQPEATSMSKAKLALVKEQQELIEELKDKVIGISGLTKEEQNTLRMLENKEELTEEEDAKLGFLLNKRSSTFTKEQRRELKGLFRELDKISSTEPTDYYVLAFNNLIRSIEAKPEYAETIERIRNYYGSTELSKGQLNGILDPGVDTRIILTELMKDEAFKEWFEANHTSKVEYDYEMEEVVKHKRTYVWNVVRPNDPAFYNGYEIKDENGKILERINRIPSRRFYKREVKNEYRTGYNPLTGAVNLEVGVHVDNKNRWLPREDVANNPYMNKAYYELKQRSPQEFKILEAVTKWTLKFQDKLENSARNYLDFPRFEESRLEFAKNHNMLNEGTSRVKGIIKRIKNFFIGNQETMPEMKGNWSDEYKVAQLDIFDEDEEYNAPIHGLYDLDHTEVSTEFTNSLLRYMLSANKNEVLTELYPTVKALKDVLDGNGYDRFKSLSKKHLTSDGITVSSNKDQNKTRRQVVSNFIDKEFYGKTITGPGSDNKTLYALSSGMFQIASLGFFAFNAQSAVKNALGQTIQGVLEGFAGKYYNQKDYAKGEGWAFKTMGELSFQIYEPGPKSHNVQLWEVFDPTGEFHKKVSKEGMTRSFLKDISQPSGIALNFRKWTEIQSMMAIWAAMMHHTTVEQNGKVIDWIDAWETKDGKIQLKEGIDPEWGITYDADGKQVIGKKFLAKRQQMQAVMAKLQGAYDDYNQPESQRWLAMKFVSFMRRYFVPMFIDRFGFKWKNGQVQARMQVGLGEWAEGYYVSLSRHLYDVFRHGPKRLIYMTADERRAWLKTVADFAILAMFLILENALFGWDDDDPERYTKLRQKSGPLQGPFVADDEYRFNMGGFMSNHALNMMMQVRAEQQQFIPLPGFGLRNYKEMMSQLGSSAAFSPTLGTGFSLFQDTYNMMTGSEKAYYKREVGPYDWQQAGGSKFIAHLAKSAGLTGIFWQPELAIKKLEAQQAGFASGG